MTAGVASSVRVELSWPAKELWSNGSSSFGHWAPRRRAAAAAKDDAYWLTRSAMGAQLGPATTAIEHDGKTRIPIHLIAHPKTAHDVDEQNLISGLKAAFDGIAKAIRIDDKFFKSPTVEWAEPVSGGKVIVVIGGQG